MMVKIKLIFVALLFSVSSYGSTLDSIYVEILKLKLEHPTIVMSQVILETGYLQSKLYEINHNMFGMKKSGSRATTSNKIVKGFKYYKNWEYSLLDYALLQMAYYKGLSREDYLKKLQKSYSQNSSYIYKLEKIEKNLHKYLSPTVFDL